MKNNMIKRVSKIGKVGIMSIALWLTFNASSAFAQTTYIITKSGNSYQVDGESFDTPQAAVNHIKTAANGAPCTIQFETGTNTLDIGSNNISFSGSTPSWGLITLTGSLTSSNNAMNAGVILLDNGVSIISQANIITNSGGSGGCIRNNSTGTVTISGGTVETTGNNGRAINNYSTGAVTISGGTVSATTGQAIYNNSTGAVTISSGTISATTGQAIYSNSTGKITISGTATVTSANTSSSSGTIFLNNSGSWVITTQLEIIGGTVRNTATGNAIWNNSTGEVKISGGTVEATTGRTIYNYSTSAVTIIGGTVKATGNNGTAVYNNNGTVTISGGTVETTGNSGRAVYNNNGTVTISGGTVEAAGNNGIAVDNDDGTVTISGGIVRATTGYAVRNDAMVSSITLNNNGVVFAYGTGASNVIYGTYNRSGNAVIVAWNKSAGTTTYEAGTSYHIFRSPTGAIAVWAIQSGVAGIAVNYSTTAAFIPIDGVTVTTFVPVTDITGVPTTATAFLPLTLTGTVVPSDATNKTITWSVDVAGTTGATITAGNILNTTGAGTAVIKATIVNGATPTSDFAKTFNITVTKANLAGTVSISGDAIFGQTLTAVTSGLTSSPVIPSLGTLSYQWRRGTTNISGAIASTYTLVQADIGSTISVVVSAANCNGTVTSANTATVTKANQAAPPAPTLLSSTPNNITLNTVAGCEYRRDGGVWQDATSFGGLSPSTAYSFTQRYKETATHFVSPESPDATFSTSSVEYTPVTDIIDVPTTAIAFLPLTLSATIVPADATNKTITWTVEIPGTTGATIATGTNILNTTGVGTATIKATIVNGASPTTPFVKTFNITVSLATLSGMLFLDGDPIFEQTLTANADLTSIPAIPDLGILSYEWLRNNAPIGAPNAQTYTLQEADIGATISVTVTTTHCTGSVTSAPTEPIRKAEQTAPDAPILATATATTITLNAINGGEYSINGGNYQPTSLFAGLSPDTPYTFTQRYTETDTHYASSASPSAVFTTDTTSTTLYTITATINNPDYGTITPIGGAIVEEGKDIIFFIIPYPGYKIEEVLVDGVNDPNAVSTGSHTFTNVTTNHTINVTFELTAIQHTITATAGANGAINPSGSVTVNHGADTTFFFLPNAGYQVNEVKIDGTNVNFTENQYTFTNVTADHTIHVTFKPTSDLLPFDTYCSTKWNNTFLLNIRKLEADGKIGAGTEISDEYFCRWYKDNTKIGEGFFYSVGDDFNNQFEVGIPYWFELINNNNDVKLRSTNKVIESTKSVLHAYPNPVPQGDRLTIEGTAEGALVEVYDIKGICVSRTTATGSVTELTLVVPAGVYVVRSNEEEVKVVIN